MTTMIATCAVEKKNIDVCEHMCLSCLVGFIQDFSTGNYIYVSLCTEGGTGEE